MPPASGFPLGAFRWRRRSVADQSRSRIASQVRRAPSQKRSPSAVRLGVTRVARVAMDGEGAVESQYCQSPKRTDVDTSTEPFGKTTNVGMLAATMATLAERLAHAMASRDMNARAVDLAIAKKLGKKATSASGYVHRVLNRGQQPGADTLAALAEILQVSVQWLLTGEGSMDRDATAAPETYDSLPGWAEAAVAELARGRTHGYAVRAAGRSPAFVRPTVITPDFVFEAATFWLRNAPEEEREQAMAAEAARIKKEEDKRRT